MESLIIKFIEDNNISLNIINKIFSYCNKRITRMNTEYNNLLINELIKSVR